MADYKSSLHGFLEDPVKFKTGGGGSNTRAQRIIRGVAIFAKACFGHPSPSKQQKLNATTYASGGPDSSSSPRPDPTRGRNIGSK
ncbi:hypothetical protein [Bathymodiolus platifrons methanotrophic gill symbiont]|uniref:hypothetical protein n=1 Tax=Bathymodiolus platifrons methanotrophic gill symbiont TaxID=113268 RepID=UPI000B420E56|nr:hypothetical protein [Bathymodiolus platifrons methanotrophic gill symbiont]